MEVLSPHSRRIDRELKPPRYRAFGVPEYWIVDPTSSSVEIHRLSAPTGPDIVTETLHWHPDHTLPAMTIEVATLFDAT